MCLFAAHIYDCIFRVTFLQVWDNIKGMFAELCLHFAFATLPSWFPGGIAVSGEGPWSSWLQDSSIIFPSHLPLFRHLWQGFPMDPHTREEAWLGAYQRKTVWTLMTVWEGFTCKTYFRVFLWGGGCQGCDKCSESWSSLLRLCDNVHSGRGHKMH